MGSVLAEDKYIAQSEQSTAVLGEAMTLLCRRDR
jgi:hypothetical protein